jgi:hypothetical protein
MSELFGNMTIFLKNNQEEQEKRATAKIGNIEENQKIMMATLINYNNNNKCNNYRNNTNNQMNGSNNAANVNNNEDNTEGINDDDMNTTHNDIDL